MFRSHLTIVCRCRAFGQAMAGSPVTVYVMPYFMDGYHGTAFWTSTATQILEDYEGYFIPYPYASVHRMLPVTHSWPIPFSLGELPAYQEAFFTLEPTSMDDAGAFMLFQGISLSHGISDDFQRVYIFADLAGGLDLYVQRSARNRDHIFHNFRSAGTWDPTYWWAAADWRAIGAGPMPRWADRAVRERSRQ